MKTRLGNSAQRFIGLVFLAGAAIAIWGCKKGGGSDTSPKEDVVTTDTLAIPEEAAADGNPDDLTAADLTVDTAVVADAASLQIPGTINLIPPKEGDLSLALTSGPGDYDKAESNYRLREDMFKPIDEAVGILCFISQTKAMSFLNAPAYTAYIDEKKCGMGDHNAPQGSVSYKTVLVQSTQEGTQAPKVKLWVQEHEGRETYAELTIAAGPSLDNPLGLLRLGWNQGGLGGYIETRKLKNPDKDGRDRAELLFSEHFESDMDGNIQKGFASVYIEAGQEPSSGYVSTSYKKHSSYGGDNRHDEAIYHAAFDLGHVARDGSVNANGVATSAAACLDRDSFVNRADRYNLYKKSDGSLVEIYSGQPGECTAAGKTVQTHFSYWGIWNSANAQTSELSSCKFVDFTGGTRSETPVDLVSAPGKLVKYTRAATTLGDLTGLELSSWTPNTNGQTIIKWMGNTLKFQKVATETYTENGPPVRTPASGNVDANQPWDGTLSFHVPTLDAQMSVKLASATDSYAIYYHNREVVSGTGDEPTENLLCFSNCPLPTPTLSEFNWQRTFDAVGSPYHTTTVTYDFGGGPQSHEDLNKPNLTTPMATYTFDTSALVIKEGATAFALPSGLSSSSNSNIMSGALVTQTDYNTLTTPQKSLTSGGEVERLIPTFYRWESGSSPWSQFAGVKAAGTFVKFDKPIELSYTFVQADNLNPTSGSEFYGAPVRLSYGGPGNLWGIPSENSGNYYAKFSLKPGVEIGSYKLKPIEISQTMATADAASCSGLDPAKAPNLDSLPATSPPAILAKPTGDLPLLIIAGELVSEQ